MRKNKKNKLKNCDPNQFTKIVCVLCLFCALRESSQKFNSKPQKKITNDERKHTDGKEDDDLNDSNRSHTSADRLSHKKQRKARTAFTDHQLHSMEKCFSRQKYLSVQDRMELANKLGISDTQVKTWFQNRR